MHSKGGGGGYVDPYPPAKEMIAIGGANILKKMPKKMKKKKVLAVPPSQIMRTNFNKPQKLYTTVGAKYAKNVLQSYNKPSKKQKQNIKQMKFLATHTTGGLQKLAKKQLELGSKLQGWP